MKTAYQYRVEEARSRIELVLRRKFGEDWRDGATYIARLAVRWADREIAHSWEKPWTGDDFDVRVKNATRTVNSLLFRERGAFGRSMDALLAAADIIERGCVDKGIGVVPFENEPELTPEPEPTLDVAESVAANGGSHRRIDITDIEDAIRGSDLPLADQYRVLAEIAESRA